MAVGFIYMYLVLRPVAAVRQASSLMSQLPRFEQLLDQQPEEEEAAGRHLWI